MDPIRQAQAVYGEAFKTINRYVDILATKGIDWGLMGPREKDRLWDRHILNSAALADLIPEGSTVVDVGSGAGLPGIPLAILRPDLQITLLEPLLRRFNFLGETVDELGLAEHVTVQRGRAEDCDQTFDVVTCRAVANVQKLLGWCTPLFYPHGRLVALKGDSVDQEIIDASRRLEASRLEAEVFQVRAHPEAEVTKALVIKPVR
ncbi:MULTISPECIES: 16S rRNA (guanine(527)-N(7))-methyltransferase RsmG [unclassified Luteococcus]|uniref:16S rRNA (guanine(527)-N(7))-methyltransferase RsmG n=1 Tax=unclassified Luteococcus TaxID=2639923 RepID=UPI00313B728A